MFSGDRELLQGRFMEDTAYARVFVNNEYIGLYAMLGVTGLVDVRLMGLRCFSVNSDLVTDAAKHGEGHTGRRLTRLDTCLHFRDQWRALNLYRPPQESSRHDPAHNARPLGARRDRVVGHSREEQADPRRPAAISTEDVPVVRGTCSTACGSTRTSAKPSSLAGPRTAAASSSARGSATRCNCTESVSPEGDESN